MIKNEKPPINAVEGKDAKNITERQYQYDCRHWTQCHVLEDQGRGHTRWLNLQVPKGKSHPWVLTRSVALPWAKDEASECEKVAEEASTCFGSQTESGHVHH